MPLQTLRLLLAAATLLAIAPTVSAQDYSTKPIRVIVPFAPGGGSDFIARFMAQRLSELLGKPFVIESKPGAGGNLGTEQGVRAAADGYTLTLIASSYTVNPAIHKLNFDPVNEVTPIIQLSRGPLLVLVNPSLGASALQDLIAMAKKKPGEIMYASSGQGSIIHAATELFNLKAGIKMIHVPYRGTGPALTDTLAGQTQVFFSSAATALPHVQSGTLKALAVTTAKRLPALPNVPTVAEAGLPGYEVDLWHGLIAPKGLPHTIADKINKATNESLTLKDTAEKLATDGVAPAGGTPEQFMATIRKEIDLWKKLAANGVIKAE
ncbi:MAG TPA: tripartite tricarboxylate transporter substrate binding protein [Terracidiphilus sp.]|nr:tripartite tricarboxylate transporter substrate binding protein [Terracidiphilus sp.]